MKCPVCGERAETRIYYCDRCLVYVHATCWKKHISIAHKKAKLPRAKQT